MEYMPLKVSVIMPVYNVEKYVEEAINSILSQSFRDFEFLIFNDGSTDKTSQLIKKFDDSRIKFIDNGKNEGYLVYLNRGINMAGGEYIVRMDGDDISHPRRIEKQVKFMDEHPDIGACGTWAVTTGLRQNIRIITETDPELLRCKLLFANQLLHPTVIMRASVLHKHNLFYDPEFYHTEDYKLWLDLLHYTKLANISEVLLKYRIHSSQISRVFHLNQSSHAQRISSCAFADLGIQPTEEKIKMHVALGFGKLDFDLEKVETWFLELQLANQNKRIFPPKPFSKALAEKWADICFRKRKIYFWLKKSILLGLFKGSLSFLYPSYSMAGLFSILKTYNLSGVFKTKKDNSTCVE